jgi:ABC-type cobalamin/Fe3+-siderophores transport system ATPase subunit
MYMHILEADSITLSYNGRSILSGIYIRCETGRISGLLGSNGQGKSCLMKAVYGTLNCEKSVRFNKVAHPQAYLSPGLISFLPQHNFIPRACTLKRVFHDFALDFADFQNRFSEYQHSYNSAIGSLSGGQVRLVEVYVIAKSQSCFSLLDEPFTHLSPLQVGKVIDLLHEVKKEKGLLVSDHLYNHIIDISDTIYLLKNGYTHLIKNIEDIRNMGYANCY